MSSLREAAEAARSSHVGSQSSLTAYAEFWAAATPETVLALLDIAYEVAGVVEAGQLPEAETGIFADLLARLPEEVRRG